MSKQRPHITDALLDRLVDGELSDEERRELLLTLDLQGDSWRRCALAFIEAQVWRQGLRQSVGATAEARPQGALAPRTVPPVAAVDGEDRRRWRAAGWLAIAASLVAAFGLGQQWRADKQRDDGASIASVNVAPGAAAVAPAAAAPGLPTGDVITLVAHDASGRPQRIRVPLVEGRALGSQFAETPAWSAAPELTRQLDQQGLDLTARRRYAPLFFEQQNEVIPMIVPIDDAVVRRVARPVY
ncbi:MAG: hypothetical protein IT424_08200 [Pirellulales bacterium]|nr:hypothetical protein [Pirellulales bacterium]